MKITSTSFVIMGSYVRIFFDVHFNCYLYTIRFSLLNQYLLSNASLKKTMLKTDGAWYRLGQLQSMDEIQRSDDII